MSVRSLTRSASRFHASTHRISFSQLAVIRLKLPPFGVEPERADPVPVPHHVSPSHLPSRRLGPYDPAGP